MKKSFIVLSCLCACVISMQAKARETNNMALKDTAKRAQAVYLELPGNGIIYSLNYDTRFSKRQNGIGGRIGAGFTPIGGGMLFSMPIMVNYLTGKKNGHFEGGIGAAYAGRNSPNHKKILTLSKSGFVPEINLGEPRKTSFA